MRGWGRGAARIENLLLNPEQPFPGLTAQFPGRFKGRKGTGEPLDPPRAGVGAPPAHQAARSSEKPSFRCLVGNAAATPILEPGSLGEGVPGPPPLRRHWAAGAGPWRGCGAGPRGQPAPSRSQPALRPRPRRPCRRGGAGPGRRSRAHSAA